MTPETSIRLTVRAMTAMREAEEEVRGRTADARDSLSAAYDYLFARAGLVAMRGTGLVEQGRALQRREVITPPSCRRDEPTQFVVREATQMLDREKHRPPRALSVI